MSTAEPPGQVQPDTTSRHLMNERTPLLASPESPDLDHQPFRDSRPTESSRNYNSSPATSVLSRDSAVQHVDEIRPPLSRARVGLAAFGLGCLILLQAINISMMTTTQSDIAADLNAFEQVSWFTSAYLIAMSAVAPLHGKLSAVFTPRICILASSIVLAVGASMTGFAISFTSFVAGRIITGMGAGGVSSISIIIVLDVTGPERRGIGVGGLNSGYTMGVAMGATLAGALLPLTGWRALFWIQAPIALMSGSLLYAALPAGFSASVDKPGAPQEHGDNHPRATTWSRLAGLDYLGALTLTASIVLLLFSLSSPRNIPTLPLILSALVLTTFVLNEIFLAADPVIPIALLRSRGLFLTCFATLGFMMARWTVLFFIPTFAIAVRQWPLAAAGSLIIPTNGGFAVGGILVGWLHIRRPGSYYWPTVVVYAIFPLTLVSLSSLAYQDSSTTLVILVVFLCGFTTGAAQNYILAHLLHLIPDETHYIATSLLTSFRGFAGSFGSAIGGGLFTRTLSLSLTTGFSQRGMLAGREDLVRRLLGSPKLVSSLHGVEKDVAIRGYEDGLRTLWLAAAGLAVMMIFVQAGTGWEGHTEKLSKQRERLEED